MSKDCYLGWGWRVNAHTLSSPRQGSGLILCLPTDSAASSKSSCPWRAQESRLLFVGRSFSYCCPPTHPLCPALRRVAPEVPTACLPRRAPQGDPTLPSLGLGLQSLPNAFPQPKPLTQETEKSRPSICPLVGLLFSAQCPTPGAFIFPEPCASAGASRDSRWPGRRRTETCTSPGCPGHHQEDEL